MTILQKRNVKRIGALAIGLAGLLVASVATANHGDRHRGDRHDGDRRGDHGKRDEPRFTDTGYSLLAEAELHQLDRRHEVKVELVGRAKVQIECRRKRRGYGHRYGYGRGRDVKREVWLDLEGIERVSRHKLRGKVLYIDVETYSALEEIEKQWGDYGCSGRDWDRKIGEVRFDSATLEVTSGGKTLAHWECDFDRLTKDGEVPSRDVKCYRHDYD